MYSGVGEKALIALIGKPVFFAITSGGVCAIHEDSSIVPSSEKSP
jgi:hypothetical protein